MGRDQFFLLFSGIAYSVPILPLLMPNNSYSLLQEKGNRLELYFENIHRRLCSLMIFFKKVEIKGGNLMSVEEIMHVISFFQLRHLFKRKSL